MAPARFDPVPRVVEVLSARNPKAQLQQLKEQRDGLEGLVDEVVQVGTCSIVSAPLKWLRSLCV